MSEKNARSDFWCWSCLDTGLIEIFHASTNALIGVRKCEECGSTTRYGKHHDEYRWKKSAQEISELDCPF